MQEQVLPDHQHQHHHPLHTHQGYAHMPASTMPSSVTPPLSSLNEGLHTPIVTSESSSQYYSSSEVSLNYNSTTSPSPTSSSSSDCNSPCLSPKSSNSNISDKRSTPSIGVNLRVTGQCSQGGRKYMEDYFSVAYQQSENAKDLEYAFIGIYDGHGGAEAATFAKEHLMMEIINQRLFWSASDHDVLRAIREGYIATHYAMWREQDKWPKTANGLPSTAGTTATVAFIRREKIYIGHVGDSGIVLGYQNENENFWRAKQLTVDHKPESVEERTRIMRSGGKVVVKSGVPRVVWNRPRNASHRGPIKHKTPVDEIPFLAVARSLGDLWSYNSERNEFVVSPDPDVKVIPINPKTFRCLIFGTDGLWNVVSAQEAVNTVREKEIINERLQAQRGDSPHEGNQWTNPSKSLVDQALAMWSSKKMRADNTSVVTVILYPPGQGGHTNGNQSRKDMSVMATPPAFVQPASYGLEYTQVQAEIPTYDDVTTYKEMAMKYLPPEAYRNFDYYTDDSDHAEEADTDESDAEDMDVTTKSINETNTAVNFQLQTNGWNWQQHTSLVNQTLHQNVAEEEPGYTEDSEEDDMDEDDGEDEEIEEPQTMPNEREVCVIDYRNYLQMDSEEANNATDSYINTFAESYNSLLSAGQSECLASIEDNSPSTNVATVITPTNSNSNSSSNSSNCQSVSPPNMNAIIEEQQLYQQQCMSEEDGYSLTKLETRREQESCKSQGTNSGVDTFKFFHHPNIQDSQNMTTTTTTVYSTHTERYYPHHTTYMPQLHQKPLELHSLLQQEREEEQQVAFERQQQMQNKIIIPDHSEEQNITAYACLQAVRHDSAPTSALTAYVPNHMPSSLVLENEVSLLEPEDLIEEVEEEEEEEDQEATIEPIQPSVQIHEISSSSGEEIVQEINGMEDMAHGETVTDHMATSSVSEKIEKIEILQEPMFEVSTPIQEAIESEKLQNNSPIERRKSIMNTTNSLCHTMTKTPVALTKSGQRALRSFVYASVQNENLERISNGKSKHTLYHHGPRRSLNMTPTSSTKTPAALMITPPAATSTPMIQRQLRSSCNNTPIVDYGKRTLRTRNSLTKDMKAKTALVQAAIKYHPHNTRKFLQRNGAAAAAALLVGNSVLLQEQHMTPTNRRSLNTNTSGRSIKTRNNSTNTPMTQTPHHLNLRSRQSSVSATTPNILHLNNTLESMNGSSASHTPSAASTPVIKRASLSDRRNLRSIHTRSSPRIGPPAQANFSKTTRSQSTGTNLAAPPPSPKMINAAAAVAAAATRARSLITQQRAAQANGTASVVSAVFGKRVNLRSNGSIETANGQHQTLRGRIVKKFKQ
ncbi:protein phosphatase 2C [Haematobia irritans]|uniref:protein phosphatase 2C n=1 Tax=Haematobia irritans TaxID=7368 RepID=UPI003F5029A7